MGRSQRKRRSAGVGEAWMHLQRVASKLEQLRKLASPERFQNFVWELNDFISSAKKVIDYLTNEPHTGTGFNAWWKAERDRFSADPRNKFFLNLRDISVHDCAIVPREEHRLVHDVAAIQWTGSNDGEIKDSETGEVIAYVRAAYRSIAEGNLKFSKCKVDYYFEDWPSEEILTFLMYIVANLKTLVEHTYDSFPNGFTFYKNGLASTGASSSR